ncbi:MAG TPA: hypothetical protein VF556_09055 [Pyrinomonadaceae bacterium]|jgi:hypothetical protein
MRIIVFLLTLFLGIYVGSFFKSLNTNNPAPCANSYNFENNFSKISGKSITFSPRHNIDTSRNYTFEEAIALVGKQVRNRSSLNAKCPTFGNCLELFPGETGKIISVLPSVNDSYLIEIKWDSRDSEPEDSFVTRAGKEVSFEIIK